MRPLILQGHDRAITQVKYNREGDLIFSAAKDSKPSVWYSSNGERLGTFDGHMGAVWSIDVDWRTSRFLSAGGDMTIRLWDVEKGALLTTVDKKSPVRTCLFSYSGNMIVYSTDQAMSQPSEIFIADVRDPAQLGEASTTLPANDSKVTSVVWGAVDETIVTGHDNGRLTLWDLKTCKPIASADDHHGSISNMQTSKDGTMFVTASKDTTAKLFDTETLDCLKTYKTDRPVNSACLSPNMEHVVLGGGQEAMIVTQTATSQGKFEARLYNLVFEEEFARVKGHFGPINTLAFNPSGTQYCSGAEDGFLRVHNFDQDYFNYKYDLSSGLPITPASKVVAKGDKDNTSGIRFNKDEVQRLNIFNLLIFPFWNGMYGFKRRYKVAQAADRRDYTTQEIRALKKRVRGRIPTKSALTLDELKVIKDQGEQQAKLAEGRVTDEEIDRNYAVPVVHEKTNERLVVVPKEPNPIYYEQIARSGITIDFCKQMCFFFSVLLLILNIYFMNMWIYAEAFFPLEFFRSLFDTLGTGLSRRALEFRTNLFISVASLVYSIWGMSVSTIYPYPWAITGFFTWAPVFIFPFVMFTGVQILNLTRVDTKVLKSYLLNSLYTYNYEVNELERTAWNQAQYTFKCCGVDGYEDWYVDWGYWLGRTDKPTNEQDLLRFPESCCPNYTLLHHYGYSERTRPYAIRMLYCQYYPKVSLLNQGCFYKILTFFQSFTEQLALVAIFTIGLMALAAGWMFAAHVRHKRHSKSDRNYRYTFRDWWIDFAFLRIFKEFKDARNARVGPAPTGLQFDDRPFDQDRLETRRPRRIEEWPTISRHLEEDEAEAAIENEERQLFLPLLRDPLIEVVSHLEEPTQDPVPDPVEQNPEGILEIL